MKSIELEPSFRERLHTAIMKKCGCARPVEIPLKTP